jgi:hypothetical protein
MVDMALLEGLLRCVQPRDFLHSLRYLSLEMLIVPLLRLLERLRLRSWLR